MAGATTTCPQRIVCFRPSIYRPASGNYVLPSFPCRNPRFRPHNDGREMHCLPSSSQVNQAQIYPRFDLLSSLWNPAWEPTAASPLAPRGYEAASGNGVAKSQSPRKLITVYRWLVAAAILGTVRPGC